jgi:transcriptional regulator GlxA family with amidase domain
VSEPDLIPRLGFGLSGVHRGTSARPGNLYPWSGTRWRASDQAQLSLFTTTPRPQDRLVRGVLDHVMAHPDGDLRTAVLAANAGVSVRHLTRLFREQVGEPPGQFVRHVRLEIAARMLASTSLPLPQIARACGFSSAETLRQAFVASYHITPSLFRSTQSTAAPRPPNVPDQVSSL